MTLEPRAARAVQSLRTSVARVEPVGVQAVARRHRRSLVTGLAGALAITLISVVAASALPAFLDRPQEVAATTIPVDEARETPTVIVPGDKEYPGVAAAGVFQHNTSSTDSEPFAKFFGAAAPGTVVSVISEYGSASTVVGLMGEFVLKVPFTDPPPGVEFAVTVIVGDDAFTFGFTSLWPGDVAVTANSTYGSSKSSPPFEIYYGTAPAGTLVTASSPYGSGQATAGDKGDWTLKLFFSGAPSGQAFTVAIDVGGQAFSFPFTWTQTTTTTKAPASTSFAVVEVHKDEGQGQWMKFFVTGAYGTKVRATSPYGSSDTVTIDKKGEAWVKVFFSGAPKDQPFTVTLEVNGAKHSTYTFTNTWDPESTPIQIYDPIKKESEGWIKVHGTAPPGTGVSVTSPYGNFNGTANDDGKFQMGPLYFDNPPVGESFDVTITVGDKVKVFSFTYQPS